MTCRVRRRKQKPSTEWCARVRSPAGPQCPNLAVIKRARRGHEKRGLTCMNRSGPRKKSAEGAVLKNSRPYKFRTLLLLVVSRQHAWVGERLTGLLLHRDQQRGPDQVGHVVRAVPVAGPDEATGH